MSDYIKINFTIRRILCLVMFIVCLGVCTATVLGVLHLKLWQAVLVLIAGLLAYEWAG